MPTPEQLPEVYGADIAVLYTLEDSDGVADPRDRGLAASLVTSPNALHLKGTPT
ncbi:MAG: hypothetical protein KAI47_00405 [Deltaproteobacteria bacterium]|nr:hypothetical protein [Deltaproteobacteria bacterium]